MSEATAAPIAVTVAEAARMLSVSAATMRRMVASGAVAHCRPSPGTVRVLIESLERHVRATTVRGAMNDDVDFRRLGVTWRQDRRRRAAPSRP